MVFTQTGRNEIRNWLAGSSAAYPNAVAIGTGTDSANETQTALIGEVYREASTSNISPFLVKLEMVLDTTEATGNTISEVAFFNSTSSTSGDMFIRNTFAQLNKTDSIEVQFEQRIGI